VLGEIVGPVGDLLGLADGDELTRETTLGDTLGLLEGDFEGDVLWLADGCVGEMDGELEGLFVGEVSTSADSITTSMSITEAAAVLNSSPFTTSEIDDDTPDESEEISYVTSKVYPSSDKALLEPPRVEMI
jgi:hypothetical protein